MYHCSSYLYALRRLVFVLLACLYLCIAPSVHAAGPSNQQALDNDPVPVSEAGGVVPSARFSVLTAGSVLQLLLSLLVIVALIMALAWYARKIQNFSLGKSNLPLRVVAATAVGTKERVVLVQVGEEQLLLGVAPGQVTLLSRLDTPIALDATAGESASFLAHLRKAMSAGNSR